jgi:hypothetical protein
MCRVGFELTIPVSERAKTFHALDRAAAGIGCQQILPLLKEERRNLGHNSKFIYVFSNLTYGPHLSP